jgi:hypothetical protein
MGRSTSVCFKNLCELGGELAVVAEVETGRAV